MAAKKDVTAEAAAEARLSNAREQRAAKRAAKDAATIIHPQTNGFNPKRGKSRERFALYRDGMSVAEYIAAGGYRADIPWDLERGLITTEEKGS